MSARRPAKALEAAPVLPHLPSWDALFGHGRVQDELRRGTRSEPYPSLLFVGPSGLGKRLVALWYASWLNCEQDGAAGCVCRSCGRVLRRNHPDVTLIEREPGKSSLGIGEVRDWITATHMKPYEGAFRVSVVAEAERLTEEAQNALLKTLEEPPPRNVTVLVASSAAELIPTVVSRCRVIPFRPLTPTAMSQYVAAHGAPPERAAAVIRLAEGCPGRALPWLTGTAWDTREAVLSTLESLPGVALWPALEAATRLGALCDRRNKAPEESGGALEDILQIARLWYRDLLLARALGEGGRAAVLHGHRWDGLRRCSEKLGTDSVYAALEAVDDAVRMARGNVQPRLLLQSLCLSLSGSPAGAASGRR